VVGFVIAPCVNGVIGCVIALNCGFVFARDWRDWFRDCFGAIFGVIALTCGFTFPRDWP
jgi:hypothetical protein